MRFVPLIYVIWLLSAGNAWAANEAGIKHVETGHEQEQGDVHPAKRTGEAHEHASNEEDERDGHDHERQEFIEGRRATHSDTASHRAGHDEGVHGHSSGEDADEMRDGHRHDHAAVSRSEGDDYAREQVVDNSRDDHGDGHADEVHLRPEQIQALGVRTERLLARPLGQILHAPGEVRLNRYATDRVAPRIGAQVIARHVRLGDEVRAGQALVTLSSVEMAEAQGAAVVAAREWQRVRSLGRKVVAASRFLEVQIAHQQTRARAVSYGMTSAQVDELLREGAAKADGSFVLLAPRNGTVVADDFIVGEVAGPGRALFEITDESVRWVEAGLARRDAARVSIGNAARINSGSVWMAGRVAQIHHLLDETTRTRAVRIEVPDPEHRLHPGEFVDVAIETGEGAPVLALPEAAVLRSPHGDWQVFVAGDEPGAYRPVQVKRRYATAGLAVVEGIAAGAEVVTHGAFFLASELAKGGFDPHNH